MQGEEPEESNALVMIPRAPFKVPADTVQDTKDQQQPPAPPTVGDAEEANGVTNPLSMDMSAAIPPKKNTKRAQVKTRDWRSSIQAYNEL